MISLEIFFITCYDTLQQTYNLDNNQCCFYIQESVGANRSPKSPKKEHIPDIHPHRHHSSPSRNSNGAVNGTGSTSPQTAKNGHRRVAAKSSVHTESNSTQLPTKPAELSNSHHNRLHAEGESNSTGNRADKRTTEQHISPEEKPRRVVGWRDGEKASQDMVDSGSFHLVQRAKGMLSDLYLSNLTLWLCV